MEFYKRAINGISPLIKLYHGLEAFGTENIPPPGEGFIVTPNHANWFGWDALVVGSILKDRKIRWVAWSYENVNPLWDLQSKAFGAILYNRNKKFPYEKISEEMRTQGTVVGIFPEGNNNTIRKWYRLRPFFPGCVRLSVMAGVPIVPVAISGLEEASPIFWIKEEEGETPTWLLAFPGIFPTRVKVRFGEPVHPKIAKKKLNDKDELWKAAEKIQLDVLKLLKNDRPKAYAETFQGTTIKKV